MMESLTTERNADLHYEMISDEEVTTTYKYFSNLFKRFLEEKNYPKDIEYCVTPYLLIDTIIRVDKRRAYFYCFHNNMTINERKAAALFAYWIVKFKPFTITDKRYNRRKNVARINEEFAAYIIYDILMFYNPEFEKVIYAQPQEKKFTYHDKLLYSLHYRAFTIDSMMLLVDSITLQSFEIVYDVES